MVRTDGRHSIEGVVRRSVGHHGGWYTPVYVTTVLIHHGVRGRSRHCLYSSTRMEAQYSIAYVDRGYSCSINAACIPARAAFTLSVEAGEATNCSTIAFIFSKRDTDIGANRSRDWLSYNCALGPMPSWTTSIDVVSASF